MQAYLALLVVGICAYVWISCLVALWRGGQGGSAHLRAKEVLKALDGPVLSDVQTVLVGELDEGGRVPAKNPDGSNVGVAVAPDGTEIPIVSTEVYHNFDRYAARLAVEVKLALGYNMKATTANRAVVQDWLYRYMRKQNVRVQHMHRVMPLAIALVFLKDRSELELEHAFLEPELAARAHVSRGMYARWCSGRQGGLVGLVRCWIELACRAATWGVRLIIGEPVMAAQPLQWTH